MPPDVSGLNGASGASVPPIAPPRPTAPSRALVPVEKVTPRSEPSIQSPLGRSGIALGNLLLAPDLLEARDPVAPVEMEMGLELARSHLLRQRPGEALDALDAVWTRAQHSEEGWYLRAGALTVMGLPGEGDRVAAEALDRQPTSLALRLVQSVARVLMGDLSGARAALAPALEVAPHAPALVAQQAVVLARQGHAEDAHDMLQLLEDEEPTHPALAWARQMVRGVQADRTRIAARPTIVVEGHDNDVPPSQHAVPESDWPGDRDDMLYDTITGINSAEVSSRAGDVADVAFHKLGARLSTLSVVDLARTVRLLLRAFSAGGTMVAACTPDQAHAARSLLAGMLVVLRQETGRPSPVAPILATMVPLLRESRVTDAQRMLRRAGDGVPPSMRRLLDALVRGAQHLATGEYPIGGVNSTPAGAGSTTNGPSTNGQASSENPASPLTPSSGAYPVVVQEERDLGPLAPVRFGLALLTETSVSRAHDREQTTDLSRPSAQSGDVAWRDHAGPEGSSGSALGVSTLLQGVWRSGSMPRVTPPDSTEVPWEGAEARGVGWGGARAAHDTQPERPASARAASLVAILCVAAALGAAVNGATLVALALGAGAAWMGLRRGGR